jgi:cytidylate kinase
MSQSNIIAIDGPAASGKSTLAFKLARCLGYLFFDTGVMYRAVTWAVLRQGVDVNDEAAVTRVAETAQIDVQPPTVDDERINDILLDGEDVTWALRTPEVEARVSRVSAYAGVRREMVAQQRRIGLRGNVVMVGRDIGTVVLPEAGYKFFLVASPEERARRRYRERLERGEQVSYEDVLAFVRARDAVDSTRTVSPLRPAEDAIIIDSDGLTADQVLEKVKAYLRPE